MNESFLQIDTTQKLNLENVSVVSIDGIGHDISSIKSLKYSSNRIDFGEVIHFSVNDKIYDFCKTVVIPKLTREECQVFTLCEMVEHITTDFVLIVQGDGFVVNPILWNPKFLEYDYIGAPWPISNLNINTQRFPQVNEKLKSSNYTFQIGNGGFTLRSKKLMNSVKKIYNDDYKIQDADGDPVPEDAVICIWMRKELENMGCKFPEDISFAASFSCEARAVNDINNLYKFSSDNSFGFHCRDSHPDKVKLLESVVL